MTTNTGRPFLFAAMVALFIIITSYSAHAQKWQPGHFTDVKGVMVTGFVRANPGGNGPIPNEGSIEFKSDEKANPYRLSASDLISFVAGKDSFVVAHAPGNETWAKKDYDFVRVVVDEPTKIYATRGAGSGGGGVHLSPGVGIGTGGYGTSYGGGLGISFGGSGGGKKTKMSYYYGSSTATMQHLTNDNFVDIMSDVMADEPEVVDRIRGNLYNLNSMDKLVDYFKKVKAARPAGQ
jgi:hypothetical protein